MPCASQDGFHTMYTHQSYHEICVGFVSVTEREKCFKASTDARQEQKACLEAVQDTYADVLPGSSSGKQSKLIIQVKNEEWEGEFVDSHQDAQIAHHSVLIVIVESDSHKVCCIEQ